MRIPTWFPAGIQTGGETLFVTHQGVAQLVVRTASGSLQGNLLLKTCFQRCSFGAAERGRTAAQPVYNIGLVIIMKFRGVAQLVARTAGGREVAGSSPVTPTK